MSNDSDFDLNELCRVSGVTPRTVRYYIQQGLLPTPSSRGRGARYGQGHLNRLRLIGVLRGDDMPLSRIRETLEGLDDEAAAAMLEASASSAQGSALDYVRSLLMASDGHVMRRTDSVSSAHHTVMQNRRAWGPQAKEPGEWRSQWERISITPDVELHVRRPLPRKTARAVDRLTEAARDLFRGETQ